MKKKTLAFILALFLAFVLVGCGDTQPQKPEDEEQGSQTSDQQAKDESKATVGEYYVEIKDASLVNDYEGNPAIVITYSWTNNSEKTISAMTALMGKAFQDGVQLETAIIMDTSAYDSSAEMKDIRPDTTLDVQCAYVLSNTESPVEFELGEWLTLSSKPVAAIKVFDLATLS